MAPYTVVLNAFYCTVSPLVFLSLLFLVFKPEELRQALMPTLEALYRQDPESLPFRQPVDPQLLGIPVRIRTSNKTNLVRDCTGCHFASTPLKIVILFLFYFVHCLILFLVFFPALSSEHFIHQFSSFNLTEYFLIACQSLRT